MEKLKEVLAKENSHRVGDELVQNFLTFNMMIDKNNGCENNDEIYEIKEGCSIPYEAIDLLENLYLSIVNHYDENDILNDFTKIFNLYSQNKDIMFFAFWLPFIKNREDIVKEIFNKTKIYCYKNEIKISEPSTYSFTFLNTFAFQLAIENSFNENFLNFILDQGKIKIPIEWIMEKIIMRKFLFVERALNGGNECTISSNTLINVVSERLEPNKNFRGIIQSKTKSTFQNLLSKKVKINFFNFNKQKSINSSLLKESESKGKEITNFLNNRTGNLTITKILIFASLINYYLKEIVDSTKNENVEKFNIDDLLKIVCLFDRKEKRFSIQILQGLYLIKKKKIARELLVANLLSIDVKVFKTSLEYKDLKFTLQFYQLYKDLNFYENENFHYFLIESIYNDYDNIEIYLYFLKIFILSDFINLNSTQFFLKITEDILQANGKESEFCLNFYNPVKIFILTAEVLKVLQIKFPLLDYNISRLIEKCIEYSDNLLNLIEEYKVFREIILEKDLSDRALLDIISDNNFRTLLKFKLVEKIVDDLWKGPYATEGCFLETSYNYKALISSSTSKDYDNYTKMRRSLNDYKEENYKTNPTTFKVWRENVYIKYYAEIIITILLLAMYQILTLFIIAKYQSVLNRDESRINVIGNEVNNFLYAGNYVPPKFHPENLTFTFDQALIQNSEYFNLIKTCNSSILKNATMIEILNEARDTYFNIFYDKIYFTYYVSLFLLLAFRFVYLIPISFLVKFIFQFKLKKPVYGLTLYSDICLIIWNVFLLIFWDSKNLYIMKYIRSSVTYYKINCFEFLPFFRNHFDFISGDPQWKDLLFLSIVCLCLWLRLILILRGTKNIGTIITIFFLAIDGIKYYLLFFISTIFAFACFGILNFYSLGGIYFKNILLSFYYYTIVSAGTEPMFNEFYRDNTPIRITPQCYVMWLGGLALFIVTILNSIVMFNIIIANLTNIFENYSVNSKLLFIQKKIEIRRKFYTEDTRFDSLLISIYPFEIFILLPSIIFLFTKSDKFINAINKSTLWTHFSIFALFYSLCYLFVNFLLTPISFLKILYSKFLQIFTNDDQRYFITYKIISFLTYIFLGLFLHVYYFFTDFIVFLKELNKEKIPLLADIENSRKCKIRLPVLKLILSILLYIDGNSKYKIHVEKLLEIFLFVLQKDDKIEHEEIIELFNKYNHLNGNTLSINEDFNIYHNKYENIMFKNGIDYQELCEFFSNFWDERNVIDISNMKTVINIYWKNYKSKNFFIKVSDKNYQIENNLLSSIKRVIKLQENRILTNNFITHKSNPQDFYQTIEETLFVNNKTINPLKDLCDTNQNIIIPTVGLTLLKKATDYIMDSEMIFKNDKNLKIKSKFLDTNDNTVGLGLKTKIKRKLFEIQSQKLSKECIILPIIPRNIIYLFLSSLKECQLDTTKNISENISKNHKILLDLTNKLETNFGIQNKKDKEQSDTIKKKNVTKNKINFIKNVRKTKSVAVNLNEILKPIELDEITESYTIENIGRSEDEDKYFLYSEITNLVEKYLQRKLRKNNSIVDLNNEDELPFSELKYKSSSNFSKNTQTQLIDSSRFKDIKYDQIQTSVEIISMDKKLKEVEMRMTNLEKKIDDILT